MLGMILTDWSGSGSTAWPLSELARPISVGLWALVNTMQLRKKKKVGKRIWHYRTHDSNHTHAPHKRSRSLFSHFPTFWSYFALCPICFTCRGKNVITLLPQQNKISVSGTTLWRVVYTHREMRRLMPSGLTEIQTQRTAITCRCSFCPPSYCTWFRGSSGRSRLGFFPLWL